MLVLGRSNSNIRLQTSQLTILHRLLLYYRVFALMILLANTVRNPTHKLAASDLDVAEACISLLGSLRNSSNSNDLENMYNFCAELYREARSTMHLMDLKAAELQKSA